MKDYHGTWHGTAFRDGRGRSQHGHRAANPPPNQLGPLRRRLRQTSSTTQLGTAPLSEAR